MIWDVMVRQGFNDKGKQIVYIYRVHKTNLNAYLRLVQDKGGYIISVNELIPLFRKKEQVGNNSVIINSASSSEAKRIIDRERELWVRGGISEEKMREIREQVEDPIDYRNMIDPHGY